MITIPNRVANQLLPELLSEPSSGKGIMTRKVGIAVQHKDGSVTALYKWLNNRYQKQIARKDYMPLFKSIHKVSDSKDYKVQTLIKSKLYTDSSSKLVIPCRILLIEQ